MALTRLQPFNLNTTANYEFGNLSVTGNILSGNANLGNSVTANFFIGSGNNLSNIQGANVSGSVANANVAGTVSGNNQSNITSLGTLTGLTVSGTTDLGSVSNVKISGGTANYVLSTDGAGNLNWVAQTGGSGSSISNGNSNVNIATANGNVTVGVNGNANVLVITENGANVTGTLSVSGNANVGNLGATGVIATTLAGSLTTASQPNITTVGTLGSLSVTGNITSGNANLGNAASANFFIGDGGLLTNLSISSSGISNGNSNISIPSANGNVNISTAGNANVLVVTGTGINVTGTGNFTSSLVTGGNLNVSGNAVIGGNLTVDGDLIYVNVTNLSVEDPIIQLQTGPNGAAPTSNTGKDVGTALNYYDTSAKVAWMGWDVSNAEIAFGSNVSISSEVVTFTSLANIRAGNAQLGNLASANFVQGTLTTASQPNITSVGTLGSLDVTGNVTAGNLVTSGSAGNISGANVITACTFIGNTGNFSTALNVTGVSNLGPVGNVTITGGTSGQYLQTNGSGGLSWATISTTSVSNGNSNVNVPVANGNVNISAAGNANVFVVTGTGANVTGTFNTTGNLTAANANLGNLATANFISGVLTTASQPNITSIGTLGSLSVTGNITAGNANLGNAVAANFFVGNGSLLTGITTGSISNGNSNVNIPAANGNVTISAAGNANVLVVTGTGANVTGTLTSTGNLTAANANLGNAVTANFYIGDGGLLTNISASTNSISNGNSNVNIPSANGNVTISAAGNANILVITGTGANITGTANITGNLSVGGKSNLGPVGNVVITGGTANYVLSTDGAGNLSWVAQTGGSGGSVGGSNTQIQFNDAGNFAGNAGLTFNKTTTTLTANNFVATSTAYLGAVGNITITGGASGEVLTTDGTGVLSWATVGSQVTVDDFIGNGSQTAFTLSTIPASVDYTLVSIAGTFQPRTAYNLAGNVLTFTSAPPASAEIEVTTLAAATYAGPNTGTFVNRSYTGNGVQNTFAVTNGVTANSVIVTENGVVQEPGTDYTVSGANLTFTSAPASNVVVAIREIPAGSSGGGGSTYASASANVSASANTKYILNTNSSNIVVTLPGSPSFGMEVGVIDGTGNANVNSITVYGNGANIQGSTANMTVNTSRAAFTLVYYNATQGWLLTQV